MNSSRRHFIRSGAFGLVGGILGMPTRMVGAAQAAPSPVAVAGGADRRGNILRALELIKCEILSAARGKCILLKPNMVNFDGAWGGKPALSSTHHEQLEIAADWFRVHGFGRIVVAESTPNGMTFNGFEAMGYMNAPIRRQVLFKDLNQEGYKLVDIRGNSSNVRISRLILEDAYFVVSLARLKTHNNAVATFSGKNIFMCSPVIDIRNFSSQGGRSDKNRMHGTSNEDLHDNLFLLAYSGVRPDLAIVDGYEGMEGEGPCWGTAVNSHVAVASTDWLACDRVCCELIGLEKQLQKLGLAPELPAYLCYCAQAGMGAFTLDMIELRGDPLAGLCQQYALHPQVAGMIGMDPVAPIYRTTVSTYRMPAGSKLAPPLGM